MKTLIGVLLILLPIVLMMRAILGDFVEVGYMLLILIISALLIASFTYGVYLCLS